MWRKGRQTRHSSQQTKGVEALEYGKRRRVFTQGDSATAVFCIRSERIKVTGVSPQTIVTVSLPLQ